MQGDGSIELPGWRWNFAEDCEVKCFPVTAAFYTWSAVDIEATLKALESGKLNLLPVENLPVRQLSDFTSMRNANDSLDTIFEER